LRFSRKRQDGSTPIVSGFRRKHFLITTCALKSTASVYTERDRGLAAFAKEWCK